MKVKMQLSRAEWTSFTTDVWSNPTKMCSPLIFISHFLDGPFSRKVVIGTMVFEKDHNVDYLASKPTEAIVKWHIQSKVHVDVRDSAANMVSATRHANIMNIGCTLHTLQL